MPKKKRTRTKTLYAYVTPANNDWIRKQAKIERTPGGYSGYLDQLLTKVRGRQALSGPFKA